MTSNEVSGKIPVCVDPNEKFGFDPFIADADVSLVGKNNLVPIKL